MKLIRYHMLTAFTLTILLIGFFILLSPPFKDVRPLLGLPETLQGSRYNESIEAAEIISRGEAGRIYLGRITFVYHAVFSALLYGTVILVAGNYLEEKIRETALWISMIGAFLTAGGGVAYGYLTRDFFYHGLFLAGLSILFVTGILILLNFKPKNLLEKNTWVSGLLLLIGGIIGGWLGSSFMTSRREFLEALIISRFNADLAEENVFWRALTGHEHAMIAIALLLVFLLGVRFTEFREDRFTRSLFYIILFGQLFMASASYGVWAVGKIAHLVITPAAFILILGTTLLSFKIRGESGLKWSLRIGNLMMWAAVMIPGVLVAVSLREALIFNPAFREPVWDWAELAYNVGHWHILLTTWGVILLAVYLNWPEKLSSRWSGKLGLRLTLIGYTAAVLSANLYMLANAPKPYTPNPYNNFWLKWLVEPSLGLMALGVALAYLTFLLRVIKGMSGER